VKILFLSAWYPHRYDPMPGLFVKQHAEAVVECHDADELDTAAINRIILISELGRCFRKLK
jgi:hypothetical protein